MQDNDQRPFAALILPRLRGKATMRSMVQGAPKPVREGQA